MLQKFQEISTLIVKIIMPDNIHTQIPVIQHSSNSEQQAQLASVASQPQAHPTSSPYWTPIALYYLEREAEWARG
ncbi:hypothetical protein [Acaryochloris marina]|uniref:hypothetical protein n=1 Tax=Acaryochloris marina TaxID=155978 RepID=UPI001BAF5731|nr:hypothetical protein [Acaryochloris marina]QUY44887.1 hypothetical protein I1H34_12895 [Acaryochloris marina S15]